MQARGAADGPNPDVEFSASGAPGGQVAVEQALEPRDVISEVGVEYCSASCLVGFGKWRTANTEFIQQAVQSPKVRLEE